MGLVPGAVENDDENRHGDEPRRGESQRDIDQPPEHDAGPGAAALWLVPLPSLSSVHCMRLQPGRTGPRSVDPFESIQSKV